MKRTFAVLLLLIVVAGFASAHATSYNLDSNNDYTYKEKISATKYYPKEDYSITITRYTNYDNDERHSTYDYRHGYSYRATQDYWDRHVPEQETPKKTYQKANSNEDYYYRYIPYLREYEKVKCYNSPPKNKLFYIKCP